MHTHCFNYHIQATKPEFAGCPPLIIAQGVLIKFYGPDALSYTNQQKQPVFTFSTSTMTQEGELSHPFSEGSQMLMPPPHRYNSSQRKITKMPITYSVTFLKTQHIYIYRSIHGMTSGKRFFIGLHRATAMENDFAVLSCSSFKSYKTNLKL